MSAPSNHPEVDELVDWARGDLSRKRLREIRAHCRSCPACDMKLAKILVLRTRQRREMKRAARRRRQLQMAAAIVLLVGAGAVFLVSGHFSDPASKFAELATTETIPQGLLRLRFRSDALPASTDLSEFRLKQGMEALVQEQYSLAVEALDDANREHPADAEIAAFLGIALYLSGDDSSRTQSLLALGTTHARPRVSRPATWYLANSCLRSGDSEAAVALLRELNLGELSDAYSRRADDLAARVEVDLKR